MTNETTLHDELVMLVQKHFGTFTCAACDGTNLLVLLEYEQGNKLIFSTGDHAEFCFDCMGDTNAIQHIEEEEAVND